MEIKYISIKDIKPYKHNPKTHPQDQINILRTSIREYGFTIPVLLDKNNELIAGHGRFEAAKLEGLDKIPFIKKDEWTDEQVRAYRIMDNKASQSDWDDVALKLELQSLEDILQLTGFDFDEYESMFEEIELISRENQEEHSGASPWERMSGDKKDDLILFTFGDITCKLNIELYENFRDLIDGDISKVKEVILNGICST